MANGHCGRTVVFRGSPPSLRWTRPPEQRWPFGYTNVVFAKRRQAVVCERIPRIYHQQM
jgi:hypothetical protein